MPAALADDVLLRILCYCTIPGVLRISETSKHFYALAFSKEVWLAITKDLVARLFIDFTVAQNLESLSTASLVALVKRAVHGPTTWSSRCGSPPKIIATRRISQFRNYQGSILLQGGKYVLINCQSKLICWSVENGHSVCEYRCQGSVDAAGWRIASFAAEVEEQGHTAIIMICAQSEARHLVEIVRLNFLTYEAKSIIQVYRPPTSNGFNPEPKITGNLAVVVLPGAGLSNELLLIDFYAKDVLELPLRNYKVYGHSIPAPNIAVVSDLIMIPRISESGTGFLGTASLDIWHYETLMNHWRTQGLTLDLPPPLFSKMICNMDLSDCSSLSISVFPSPLDDRAHAIWVRACTRRLGIDVDDVDDVWFLQKYRVSLDEISGPASERVQFLSSRSIDLPGGLPYLGLERISYAGFSLSLVRGFVSEVRIFSYADQEDAPAGETPQDMPLILFRDEAQRVDISAYSGALTYTTEGGVVVDYYE